MPHALTFHKISTNVRFSAARWLAPELAGATGERLMRPQFGMGRFEWPDDDSVEFHLPHGEMLRVLRGAGFEVERLVEVQAPADAVQGAQWDFVTPEWARKWPTEEAWIARKRS